MRAIRCGRLSAHRRAHSRYAHHAGAGAVSAHLMALPSFRFRTVVVSGQVQHQRAVPAELKADVLPAGRAGWSSSTALTEGGGTCILEAHMHPDKLHTVGKPAATSDIRLIDDDGHELPPSAVGTPGEVVGRSPGMMTGYHNQPENPRGGMVRRRGPALHPHRRRGALRRGGFLTSLIAGT